MSYTNEDEVFETSIILPSDLIDIKIEREPQVKMRRKISKPEAASEFTGKDIKSIINNLIHHYLIFD